MKLKILSAAGLCVLVSLLSCAKAQEQGQITLLDVDVPEFVNQQANTISMPDNADIDGWKRLAADMTKARQEGQVIDIMHIGDSHIQAEIVTGVVRSMLQQEYGNAGRGLMPAYKLAGTNQPGDYDYRSTRDMDSKVRLLKRPWEIEPGFTGVAALSNDPATVTLSVVSEGDRFNRARIFTSEGERTLTFDLPVDSATFDITAGERVFGAYTCNSDSAGIIYSAIGNNGACYSDYLLLDGFADDVAKFSPRLIVLSMGANEAYSGKSDAQIVDATRRLVHLLKKANPEAMMLIWLPMESEIKGDDGKYVVLDRVKEAHALIAGVGAQEGIPVWDFYDVAGGDGAAALWVENNLMKPSDHIHLTGDGYRLQGRLAATALINFFNTLNAN